MHTRTDRFASPGPSGPCSRPPVSPEAAQQLGCEPNALEGKVAAFGADGKKIAETTVRNSAGGYSHSHGEPYGITTISGHPFLTVPEQPAGQKVAIRGTLDPEPARVYHVGPVVLNEGLPLPNVKDVRVWVAP